jgi:molybdopterin synthase sulfur carrier subunit
VATTVRIPAQLRPFAGGAAIVEADGPTVGAILKAVEAAHPGFGERIFDESGALRRSVNLFLDDEDVCLLHFLDTPVAKRQVISIVPAVAGG